MKRLYRSEINKSIAGVMGGLGEYLDIDPVLLRVLYVFLSFLTGLVPGIIAYIVAAVIIPRQPKSM